MSAAFDTVVARLRELGNTSLISDTSALAACPARPDHLECLRVRDGSDGRVQLHCICGGCQSSEIEEALGDTPNDLFYVSTAEAEPSSPASAPTGTQANVLVQLAQQAGVECFHHVETPYLFVPVGDHHETYRLRSQRGRALLQGLYIDAVQKGPGGQGIADATNTLEALALRGPEHRVHVRIAAVDDAIYLDLGDPTWRVVEIRATGWQVTTTAPVRFRRPKALLALPPPTTGGSIQTLRGFVNVTSDDDFVLLVLTLVAMLRGRGPYPILVKHGEQGSAKSTLDRIIKALIDPNAAPLRSEPKEPRDLMIAASNNHVLAFDNLSSISPWLSDCFCRLATGGGFSTRMLYQDAEEQIFDAVRPLVLNGIVELATRPDLVSRAVLLNLPHIADEQRRDETALWSAFERERPAILGALLDLVVTALDREPGVQLEQTPRMADFARWAVAAEAACPWPAGRFLQVYASNRQHAAESALDGEPLAEFARAIVATGTTWTGTASDLLTDLNRRTPESVQRRPDWFKKPRQVADGMRRLAPALRQVGVNVVSRRQAHTGRRLISISPLEPEGSHSSPSSPSSPTEENRAVLGDEQGDEVAAARTSSPESSPEYPNETGPRDGGDVGDEVEPLRSNEPTAEVDNDDF